MLRRRCKISSKQSYSYSVKRPEYKKSKKQLEAEQAVKKWENSKPEAYSGRYTKQLDDILNSVLNREDFKYSLNADPLYKEYRDLYVRNAQRAMNDTVGRVAALSGGLGSSYAATAGSQSYNNELAKLNSVALDLYDRAYGVYKDKGDGLYESAQLLRSLSNDDYKMYRDIVSDYYKDGDYLTEKLKNMSDAEYEQFLNEVKAWENDRDFSYDKYLDEIKAAQYDEEMAFKRAEAQRAQANADRSYNLSLQKLYASNAKSSSSAKSTKNESESETAEKVNYPKTYAEFVKKTGKKGVMTQKEFSIRNESIAKYRTYENYLKAMYEKYMD